MLLAVNRDAARAYMIRGWSVLPLKPGEKVPSQVSWVDQQKKAWDAEKITFWWTENPDHNVGVITGPVSGLTVIDLDGPHASELLRSTGIEIPDTFVVKTPHGHHLYFQYDKRLKQTTGLFKSDCNCPKKCAIDVRNDGGYVVAPPSIGDGVEYTTLTNHDVAPLPEGLIPEKPRTKDNSEWQPSDQPRWIADALLSGAPDGQRNDTAVRLAGYFHQRGIPHEIVMSMLRQFADSCIPPMDYRELETVVRSVARYQRNPTGGYKGTMLDAPIVDLSSPRRKIFRWPDLDIMIDLDRIREERGAVKGWIRVATSGLGQIYGPLEVNLLSTRGGRADFIREMSARIDLVDWASVFQHVASITVDTLDQKHPTIALSKHKSERPSPWLAKPFIRYGQNTTFYADGGTGKSLLALAICVSLASGKSIIPGLTVTERVNSFYGDWETDADSHQTWLEALMRGADIDTIEPNEIYYRRFDSPIADQAEELQRFFIEHEIGFAVTDSVVAAATGENVNSDGAPRMYFNAIRSLDVPTLGITHVPMGDGKPKKQIYGNRFFWNLSRMAWYMEKTDDKESVALYNEKTQWDVQRPIGFRPVFVMDASNEYPVEIRFKSLDVAADPQLAQNLPPKQQVFTILKRGEMQPKEIAEETGLRDEHVRQILRRGLNQDPPIFVKNSFTGKYGNAVTRHVTERDNGNVTEGEIYLKYISPNPSVAHEVTEENTEEASKEW